MIATTVTIMVVAAVALAALGDLTPAGCLDDNDSGPEACGQSADGLDGVTALALSADGKSLYAAADVDDAITAFNRDTTTGDLTPAGCLDDTSGAEACGQSADGLRGVGSLAVSADGKSLYAGSRGDAIAAFSRDTTTGGLTPAGCLNDNDTGPDACGQSTDGLNDVEALAVSADGKSLYAASIDDDAITAFSRDTSTGALTPAGCLDDNDSGPEACVQSADGLDNVTALALSADGKSLYAAANVDDAITAFSRDTSTGALTPAGCLDDNDSGPEACGQSADGLDGVTALALSADGKSLYAAANTVNGAASGDNAITAFSRDTTTGDLTPAGCLDDNDTGADVCGQSADGLDDVGSLAVSADGKSLYGGSIGDDAITAFNRDTSTGALTPAGCLDDNDSGPETCGQSADGLYRIEALALSADGKSLYAAAIFDRAITAFDREATEPNPNLPNTTIDSGPTGLINDDTPRFTFSSSEAGSTFECRVDGDPFAPCSGSGGSHTTFALIDGAHQFTVRAIDADDNADPTPATRTFTVDTEEPDTEITKAPKKKLKTKKKATKVKVSFGSEARAAFECRLDKAKFESCASPFVAKAKSKPGEGKKHTISVAASDVAGNVEESPATVKFRVIRKG